MIHSLNLTVACDKKQIDITLYTEHTMKKLISIIILFSLLLVTQISWAYSLHYNITGINNNDALQNALNRLNVIAENNGAPLSVDDINNFHTTAADNIRLALQPFGYFKAQVSGQLSHQGNTYYAKYQVNPGHKCVSPLLI